VSAAIGSRVKFLIDTPEAIWGLLDAQQALAAARRFLCAECVHKCLRAAGGRTLARQFPLLRGQWGAVAAKRGDIGARARALLEGKHSVEEVRAARAVAERRRPA
jgi:conserved oligomeric Golgi complex subunit 1